MGHGDQWEAVEKDTSTFINTMLALICKEGKLVGENSFRGILEDSDRKEGLVFGLQYPVPETPVSFLALAIGDSRTGHKEIWTAYPLFAEGPCTRLEVDEVNPWANGIEGSVEAYMPAGDVITFFDPFFFLNREKYQEWAKIDVALSALAYLLEKAEPDQDESADEPQSELPGEQAQEASLSDSVIMASLPEYGGKPSEYFPCGEHGDSARIEIDVEEAVPVACTGRLFWRMTGVIMWADDATEMRIHLYASEQVLKGYLPQPGDHVLAVAWIQGRLLRVAPKEETVSEAG